MKKLRECENDTLLVALLLAGILMVMGAYRIFSYLCENARMDTVTFLLAEPAPCWRWAGSCWHGPASGG